MASVSNAYLHSVLAFLNDQGISTTEIKCNIAQLSSERIAMKTYVDLLNFGAERTELSLFGFELGKHIQARDYGVLGYLVESCENLAQAIDVLGRFDALVADIGQTQLNVTDTFAHLDWQPLSTDCKQMVLRNTTAWVATVRKILGETLSPNQVTFSFALSAQEIAQLKEWFNCEVITNTNENRISFDKTLLALPFTSENKAMFQALVKLSETELLQKKLSQSELSQFIRNSNIKQQVATLLSATSNLQGCDQKRIAEALFMSARTLQRKLKAHQTSFSAMLEAERKSRIDNLLKHNTIAQTAYELGFVEQSSFTHACKKWFGITPLAYQKSLLGLTDKIAK
ncbi:AraC family transcriptional regulator [Pseudoalteromonas phenolica]|uniref:AraC family transcriptional regulator n=1 Tax=Pseudoalteromonas phenolica TaxID=161398 RepID=A0A5R9Q4A1_9GAMM|nr:AraC family transcriptional regulator [Pseudoalteromonas phenolica]TLX47462.1 AraC family transcriptional regulator [Pseudoalteromonas phenolica]